MLVSVFLWFEAYKTLFHAQNNHEKTDPSEIERTYNIRKQRAGFY